MLFHRRTVLRAVTFFLAFLLVGGFFLHRHLGRERDLARESDNSASRAFSELVDNVNALSVALEKASFSTSPSVFCTVSGEAYARASAAESALGVLPESSIRLEHTAGFLTKSGDYCLAMVRLAASGQMPDGEEQANLIALSAAARGLADSLTGIHAGLISGEYDIASVTGESLAAAAEGTAVGIAADLRTLEDDFPALPTLVYDGPFSEHLTSLSPLYLAGKREITSEEALFLAADFTGITGKRFSLSHERHDELPVYVVTASSHSHQMTVEVTERGGCVLYFGNDRPVVYTSLSRDAGIKLAKKFLISRGLNGFRETYSTVQDNKLIVSFAFSENGIMFYPDLVKVAVALDNGEIVGFESRGFLMNHQLRDLPAPAVSEEAALEHVPESLTVLSSSLAVIPTRGKKEVFCREFKCEGPDGRHCLIYINAESGVEEDILLLIEDENGTLAV